MQFFGQHETKLDDKSRVVFPARFKAQFGTGPAYLIAGRKACITVFTDEGYGIRADKIIDSFDEDSPEGEEERRRFFGSTDQVPVDAQGRVTIPPRLRAYADLTPSGPLLLIGTGPSFEIWNPAVYERRNET